VSKPIKLSAAEILAMALAPRVKALGFKKQGLNWSLKSNDCTLAFNIQKSAWGPGIYFNAGLFINALHSGEVQRPLHNRADINGRIVDLLPDNRTQLRDLVRKLEEGHVLSAQEVEFVSEGLTAIAIPELIACFDLKALQRHMKRFEDVWAISPEVSSFV
jgi:hypothetical protein